MNNVVSRHALVVLAIATLLAWAPSVAAATVDRPTAVAQPTTTAATQDAAQPTTTAAPPTSTPATAAPTTTVSPPTNAAPASTSAPTSAPEPTATSTSDPPASTSATSPAWNTVLVHAGALVTANGGLVSHAAVTARELGIPAVIGDTTACTRLRTGCIVTVDPVRATVVAVTTGR